MLGVGSGEAAVAPVEDDSEVSAARFRNPGMSTTSHLLPSYWFQVTG